MGAGEAPVPVQGTIKNGDGTVGELYLVCSDSNLSYEQITTIYKKRWGVEVYHKSTKKEQYQFCQVPNQNNEDTDEPLHAIYHLIAYVKLEGLKLANNMNHFAMKARIYQAALKAAYQEL